MESSSRFIGTRKLDPFCNEFKLQVVKQTTRWNPGSSLAPNTTRHSHHIWRFPKMGPKSSLFMGFFLCELFSYCGIPSHWKTSVKAPFSNLYPGFQQLFHTFGVKQVLQVCIIGMKLINAERASIGK